MEGFSIVENKRTVKIYVDSGGKDTSGIHKVAHVFVEDVKLVTGETPTVLTKVEDLQGDTMIVGILGQNKLIDDLIANGKLDPKGIRNKRECYRIQMIEKPFKGVDRALVVAGSDKRGTIYGLFYLSEQIGVSPWVFFGDVVPAKQENLILSEEVLNVTSKEPSVKYRGFFLNDEWPSLGNWCKNRYGGFNEEFYEPVFQLLLRLKGNYLWPAMWTGMFSEDGKKYSAANAQLANEYGIVMGTSHHEGLFRAGEEWQTHYKEYGESDAWDFANNSVAITKFWEDAVLRNKDFENVITLGMRGERDSALGGGLQENVDLLKRIILTQKELLRKNGIDHRPKVLILYKEVEQFWYGSSEVEGLRDWDELSDVMIMLCDDNFGNVRTLPTEGERQRNPGFGMYYHFDYHGGPISYEWVNTVPLAKVWEQMSMTYDYGVRDIWIVNVGDLKPMEFPLSYFLDLAYDFETWGTKGIGRTEDYTVRWVKRQFSFGMSEDVIRRISWILTSYIRLNGNCKPEVLSPNTYSITCENEAMDVLALSQKLIEEVKEVELLLPIELKDAYYQLIYFPAVASANVNRMQIYAGLNHHYAAEGNTLADHYGQLVEEAIEADQEMEKYYNEIMAGGKWRGMMSSPHIGYVTWNSEGWHYPEIKKGSFQEVKQEDVEHMCYEVMEPQRIPELPPMTFVGANGIISVEAEHFAACSEAQGAQWRIIPGIGRTGSGLKMFPTTVSFEHPEEAPTLTYNIYVERDGEVTLTLLTSPSNNLTRGGFQRVGISFDGAQPIVHHILPGDYSTGDYRCKEWCLGVLRNIHQSESKHILCKGFHVLHVHGMDAGVVLQKLVMADRPLPSTYLGPKESDYYQE